MENPLSFNSYSIRKHNINPDRKLILNFINSFLKSNDLHYHSEIQLIDSNPNLWTEASVLLKLGKLLHDLGGYYYSYYLQYFVEKWIHKTEFKPDMISKIEHFFKYKKNLSSRTRYAAIKAIGKYRTSKNIIFRDIAKNDLEWDLVRAMQTGVSNQLGRYIGVSELSTIFKGWDGYFRRVLYNTNKLNFGIRSLNQIILKTKKPISYNFQKTLITFQLSIKNQKIIENAVENYIEIRLKDVKYKYIVPFGAPNEHGLRIIELLRKAYSKHPVFNPSNKFISYTKLFKDIMKKPTPFEHAIDNKHPFTENMIDYISTQITKDLLDIYEPEIFTELNNELNSYPSYTRSYESEPEEVFRYYMNHIFKSHFEKRKHLWLKGRAGRLLELDGCNLTLKVAFECDGPQHYDLNFIMRAYNLSERKAKIKLERQVANDQLKDKGCTLNGFILIRFRPQKLHYKDYQDYIIEQYRKLSGDEVSERSVLNYQDVLKRIRNKKKK